MKEIKAYVHANRIAAVIQALKDSEVFGGESGARRHNLTVYEVKGSLPAQDATERHFSLTLGEEVIHEYKLEMLCEDTQVDELLQVIRQSARCGRSPAGWIYVVDVVQAIRIQSAEASHE